MANLLSRGSVILQPQAVMPQFGLYGCVTRPYSTPGSAVFTLANRIYYYPFRIPELLVAATVKCVNGSTANGNLDMGIYSAGGARLASTGTTAQSGTSAPQSVALSAPVTLFPSECYYFAITHSNTTGTFFRYTLALALYARVAGVLTEDAGAFGLPAAAAFAAAADNYMVICGIDVTGLTL